MQLIELAGVLVVLLGTVAVGTVAHELSHAAVLRYLGVPYDVEWRPERDRADAVGLGMSRTWASVTPRTIPDGVSSRGLRASAIAPLSLAFLPLLVAGLLPGAPLIADSPYLLAATVAWVGCALPSPQDFSLFWYADRAIEAYADDAETD
jgi:hypothetical protein